MTLLQDRLTVKTKKYRKAIYVLVFLILFFSFLFKPFTIFVLDGYLSHALGQKVTLKRLQFIPFEFDGVITTKTFPQGVFVNGVYRDKYLYMTSTSLGGLVTIVYKDHRYKATVDSIDLKTFVEFIGSKKYIESGVINGTLYYDKRPRSGYTKLKVSDAVLHNLNLDKKLATINDALTFDFGNVISRTLFDSNSTDKTYIDHMQFNILYRKNHISTSDIALRTENYRLSIGANVHKKGQIDYFDINLLDKNGCAVVTQTLEGDVRRPRVKNTTTELVNIARTVPSSMFGMGVKMMSYANQQNVIEGENFMGSKQMMSEANNYMQETSKIVMPIDCSVVYNGEVKHPEKKEKDLKVSSRFRLP